ncbi:MAG: ABC transporter permease subunit [Fibrobacter sp.]|jgi:microcin C transport system permease protein|nr:ABC transporter permease subunit [Fibrobacter sp.]
MRSYILRRLLLMIPTLIGISLVCFILIQLLPGGPVEELISRAQQAASMKGGVDASKALSPEQIAQIQAYFGFDQPAWKRYLTWLWNVLHLNLGESYTYGLPVWDVIVSRFPISLFFGVTSFFLSYLICIPLGLWKAVHHGSKLDSFTSGLIFSGYVMPGYALGILLIIFLAGGSYLDIFPLGGLTSDDFEDFTFFGKVFDLAQHLALPIFCYMISEFAFLTFLMKNSALEELGRDYMRTALAKGLSFNQALVRHALRNALIPIATRLSEICTLMFAGALLIEKVFDIDGMGLLYYNSMVNRDYNVVMGIIFLSSLMAMIGRLFSDILYTLVDPRIKFS